MKRLQLKPLTLSFVAAGLLAGTALIAFNTRSQAADTAAPAPVAKSALTVTTAPVTNGVLPIKMSANGNVLAWQEAVIGAEVGGLRIQELNAQVGDVVKRGQVLARFSAETIAADVAMARAAMAEASASAADATANAQRARAVQDTGALSAQQISQYMTAEQVAKARVESAKATLAAQQLRLKYTQVLAPDDGIVSARTATLGAVAGTGAEMFRLIRQGRLEWRAELTSAELGKIAPGTPVVLTAPNGVQTKGRVRVAAPTVDAQTRIGLVYVDLTDGLGRKSGASAGASSGAFRPGMYARGEFELGSSNALTIPQQAVVVRDGFNYAFKVDAQNHVRQVKLQTGRRMGTPAGDVVEVLQGLAPGMQVVSSGAGFLNDGDLVKVSNQPVALSKQSNNTTN